LRTGSSFLCASGRTRARVTHEHRRDSSRRRAVLR
jgi:hypothetical protein